MLLPFLHLLAEALEPVAEHLLGLREHLPFFLLDVMRHIFHEHRELRVVALILWVQALQLFHQRRHHVVLFDSLGDEVLAVLIRFPVRPCTRQGGLTCNILNQRTSGKGPRVPDCEPGGL